MNNFTVEDLTLLVAAGKTVYKRLKRVQLQGTQRENRRKLNRAIRRAERVMEAR